MLLLLYGFSPLGPARQPHAEKKTSRGCRFILSGRRLLLFSCQIGGEERSAAAQNAERPPAGESFPLLRRLSSLSTGEHGRIQCGTGMAWHTLDPAQKIYM